MSWSRIHCGYIMGTEFKGKHILEQDELFCCVIISFGLKQIFYVLKTKECRKKNLSFSPLENPFLVLLILLLVPHFSSSFPSTSPSPRTPDFLSSYLRLNSVNALQSEWQNQQD